MPLTSDPDKLYILWASADPIVADKMLMYYAAISMLNGWWRAVTIIIWGSSPKMVAENMMIQEQIKAAMRAGVQFSACRGCADELGVTGKLVALDIEVVYWGERLTSLIKSGANLITI